jgi:hypothetical protein
VSDEDPKTWDGKRVLAVVDEWRVVDRWWTEAPINRVYLELELEDLDRITVYKEGKGEWQRA